MSVFVALKHARRVRLALYSYPAGAAQPVPTGDTTEADTVAIGQHLHACVVTVKPASALVENVIYAYNLNFTRSSGADSGPAQADLGSLDLLNGRKATLGYEVGRLPGFAISPGDVGWLNLVHASCRMPHGEGLDMLPTLDTFIQNSHKEPYGRPHQLFLTGDQIYADDVSQPLLALLTDSGDALLGWSHAEVLPVVNKTASVIKPGARAQVVKSAGFTSGAAHSHLLTLGEYLAMYAFVWSDAIWPVSLPDFATVFPDEAKKIAEGPADPEMRRADAAYVRALQVRDTYGAGFTPLTAFREGLPAVRRALANVPTYMMFDDHEVTDDWFIDLDQRTAILANPLGTRVTANALSAYAVFQAWGNDPAQFEAGKNGRKLLDRVAGWRGAEDATSAAIKDHLALPGAAAGNRVNWDYEVGAPNHHVVVLDTRTRRSYPGGGTAAPDLLGTEELQRQLTARKPSRPVAFSLVVSPAPVIGHPFIEEQIQGRLGLFSRKVDREAWSVGGRRNAFEELLQRLAAFEKVVILSGDIHYAFTAKVNYWNERVTPEQRAGYVQLVCSALKKEDGLTRAVGGSGWKAAVIPNPPWFRAFLGWSAPGDHLRDGTDRIHVDGTPAVIEVPRGDGLATPPQWRYQITFSTDQRTSKNRQTIAAVSPGVSPMAAWLDAERARAWTQREVAKYDQMRICVGHNNIGRITFAVGEGLTSVGHEIWYRRSDATAPVPYTLHSTFLDPPSDKTFKPTALAAADFLPDLSAWADLISFRPPSAIQQRVRDKVDLGLNSSVHRLEDGHGPINLDYYPVKVTTLPQIHGTTATPELLLLHVRLDLNAVIDVGAASFEPFDSTERTKWVSADPLGTIVHIDMAPSMLNPDDGSVVASEIAPDHWTFSTIWITSDFGHPVSGNRWFGYLQNDDRSYTFFTRGADRPTSALDEAAQRVVFDGAHTLWLSFQRGLAKYVNENQGAATVEPWTSEQYAWRQVAAQYWSPKTRWTTF